MLERGDAEPKLPRASEWGCALDVGLRFAGWPCRWVELSDSDLRSDESDCIDTRQRSRSDLSNRSRSKDSWTLRCVWGMGPG